jgi:hypothetical protein
LPQNYPPGKKLPAGNWHGLKTGRGFSFIALLSYLLISCANRINKSKVRSKKNRLKEKNNRIRRDFSPRNLKDYL